MDNRRFMLFACMGVVIFFMYQAWQKDYGPRAPSAIAAEAAAIEVPTDGAAASNGDRIFVETDKLRAEISLSGGELRRLELLGIPVSKHQPDRNLHLLDDRPPNFFVLQSGLIAPEGETAPDHHTLFTSTQNSYRLSDGVDQLEVPLTWREGAREVTKTFVFPRGGYQIELRQQVKNQGAALPLSSYVRFWRTPVSEGDEPPFVQTFMGVGMYQQKSGDSYHFKKIKFDDLAEEPLRMQQVGGWIALLQHYFAAAAIPTADGMYNYYAKPRPLDSGIPAFEAGYVGPQILVPANGQQIFTEKLYLGPKLQGKLDEVATRFDLTADYGILTVLAAPLFWVLAFFHKLTGNWGVAIILLTVAVKLSFWKLTEAQYRSMAHMKKFAPRIQALKERYADDREGMQKAMMDLYKKEKFNPLGGCWPLLVQFPVFIALYWVLLESVELRQAPFMLWIQDMSAPDPLYIMPVLFGISMWAQQKLSGSTMTMDPAQQRIMNLMPIGLTAFFTMFPAGLVVYWFVSNLIGISQQWYITRKLTREESAK